MNFGWTVLGWDDFLTRLPRPAARGPVVVAVTGHGSSGKTTLSARLEASLPGVGVLHTDDLAWYQGVFSWDALLLTDVLPVVWAGAALNYRPPQWQARNRPGAVELPGCLDYLVIEGVGASQPSVRAAIDVVIWVETDEPTRLARHAVRVGAGEISPSGHRRWMVEENTHMTEHQPWRTATMLVYGGDSIPHDRTHDVVVAARYPSGL